MKFRLNKIAKYCAPAADGDGIGSTAAAGGNIGWEIGSMTFIDDPEAMAQGLVDPLDRKPGTGLDAEHEETPEEEENPEEEEEHSEEEEEAPEEEEEAPEEEEEDPEEEEENPEEEEENPEEEAKKPEDRTNAGLRREISKLRGRAQAAEAAKVEADKRAGDLQRKVAEEIPALRAQLRELIKARNAAAIDEDTDAMTEADMDAEDVRAKINKIERDSERASERAEAASAEVSNIIQDAATRACELYDVLNPSSKVFDVRLVDMINAVYTGNLAKGAKVLDAFEDAVGSVMELTGNAKPQNKAKKAAAVEKKLDATAKRRQAASNTPRTTSGKNRGASNNPDDYRFEAKDFRTEKGRKKLQSTLGIIIPR